MQLLRHWIDVAAIVWLGMFCVYFVVGTLFAIFGRKRPSDRHLIVDTLYFLWMSPFFLILAAFAGISWIWGKLFKSGGSSSSRPLK